MRPLLVEVCSSFRLRVCRMTTFKATSCQPHLNLIPGPRDRESIHSGTCSTWRKTRTGRAPVAFILDSVFERYIKVTQGRHARGPKRKRIQTRGPPQPAHRDLHLVHRFEIRPRLPARFECRVPRAPHRDLGGVCGMEPREGFETVKDDSKEPARPSARPFSKRS